MRKNVRKLLMFLFILYAIGFSKDVSAEEPIDSKEMFMCDVESHNYQGIPIYWRKNQWCGGYRDTFLSRYKMHIYKIQPHRCPRIQEEEDLEKIYCSIYRYVKEMELQLPEVTWFAARYQGKESVQLYWKGNSKVDGYILYRRKETDEAYRKIVTLSGDVTSFVDDNIENGVEYYYKISTYQTRNGIKYERKKINEISPATIFSTGYQNYSIQDKIEIAKMIFPQGSYWNHHDDLAHGVNYEEECMRISSIPCDHKNYLYHCNYYYGLEIEGKVFKETMQCLGFANMLSVFFSGNGSEPKEFKDFESLQVGDQIRFISDSHSVVVIEKNEDSVTVAECNSSYKECEITWGRVITRDEIETQSGTYVFLTRIGN